MRLFWALLALLAAGGLWFVLAAEPQKSSVRADVASPEGTAAAATQERQKNGEQNRAKNGHKEAAKTEQERNGKERVARNEAGSLPALEDAAVVAPSPSPLAGSVSTPASAPVLTPTSAFPSALAPTLTPTSEPASPQVSSAVALPVDTRSPAEITRRIDARTLELDGRFRVIGVGSPDDPYRISWELLTSAGPFIDPKQQALTPPSWVRAIDGSYIEISAYYSTALRVTTTRHVLLTLNRWDGCCIGLPPTPFDAIDTTLAKPLDLQGLHLFRFGTFRGRLVVEPFAAGTYLLGLYRLEDATFVAQ